MSKILDYIIIFLTILALIIGGYYFYLYFTQEYFPPDVEMPDVIGLKYQDALKELDKVGLRVEKVLEKPSKKYKKGLVIRQKPLPGIRVKKERGIYLEVSSGKLTLTMPDLKRMSIQEATSLLKRLGLKIGHIYEYKGKLPIMVDNDIILNQKPLPLTSVPLGKKVDLWVVKNLKEVKLPDFTGKSLSFVKRFLNKHNLYIGTLKWIKSKFPSGTILNQNPLKDSLIKESSMVSFLVSSGKRESDIVKMKLIVKLPLFKDIKKVSIAQEDKELTKQIYQGTNKGGDEISLDLEFKKEATIKIYIEGKLKKEFTVK